MSEEHTCIEFQQPTTLKDILDFLGRMDFLVSDKKHVFIKLLEELKAYCKNTDKFCHDSGGLIGGSILLVCKYDQKIREALLKDVSGFSGKTGQYAKLTIPEVYANAFKNHLPSLYSALYYLYFNVAKGCNKIGGGEWNDKKVQNTADSLGQWLTKEHTSKPFTPGLVKRGFNERELHNTNNGQNVATEIQNVLSHDSAKNLQNVLCCLLFACDWHEALLGHGVLFVWDFCNHADGLQDQFRKQYPQGNFGAFQSLCTSLKADLDPLVKGKYLSAVCKNNINLYDDIFSNEYFDKYISWMENKLDSINSSLKKMSGECSQWNSQNLKNATSAGPFQYGFVFTDGWGNNNFSQVTQIIDKLTDSSSGSLGKLKEFLKSPTISATTESSPGAAAAGAAGGILSLGGAGFGAAYGFNLFGLKDIMSGVFGAIRGLVVGF
ncbi:secreted antigen 3 [Babesia divergens]|uniref:Secreted antigen 3 n=1 Tax=Babesia divergens TaxID=32595 RepID=A0AAD9GD44_BABDI|nr:secreted antigen 3 [Babesia divergens]